MNWLKHICNPFSFQLQQVRFRYFADKLSNGPTIRRYGYKDRILQGGLMPRLNCGRQLPIPTYRYFVFFCIFTKYNFILYFFLSILDQRMRGQKKELCLDKMIT